MSVIQTMWLGLAVNVYVHRLYMWNFDDYTAQALQDQRINIFIWCMVKEVQCWMEITDLAFKLVSFVKECHKQIDGIW